LRPWKHYAPRQSRIPRTFASSRPSGVGPLRSVALGFVRSTAQTSGVAAETLPSQFSKLLQRGIRLFALRKTNSYESVAIKNCRSLDRFSAGYRTVANSTSDMKNGTAVTGTDSAARRVLWRSGWRA